MGTRVFRRLKGEKVWHKCNNCKDFPLYGDYDIEYNEPSNDEYCPECRKMAIDGSCASGQVC